MRVRPGQIALWGAAGVVAASAHLALAAWAMKSHVPTLPVPPEAIEIELAPSPAPEPPAAEPQPASEPEAAPEPAPEPEPEPQPQAEPQPSQEPELAPDFTPPELQQLSPPDFADLIPPEPAPDFTAPPLVPLPPADFATLAPRPNTPPKRRPERIEALARELQAEPEPEQPRRERRVEKPRAEASAEKPRTTRKAEPKTEPRETRGEARSNRRQAELQRARQGQSGARASAGAMRSWQQTTGARISRHMSRTRVSGARGTVRAAVTVTVQANGATSARLARGSGDPRIDAALSRQAARMPRLPAPPSGKPFTFTQPISIQMR